MTDLEDDSLLKGIAPKEVSHEEPVREKEFKPWHKPRKQLIRREQWLGEIEALVSLLRFKDKPLRYLTLPGEDMFDIRVLAKFCYERGLRLKPLGFDETSSSSSPIEQKISWSEISQNIEPCSIVLVPDSLTVLKSKSSQGFKYINENGPFDAINLDLCGSISCIDHPDNHQVLNNLCEYQVNKRREPWLLFITTRGEYEQINSAHLPNYLKQIKENAKSSANFSTRLNSITGFIANKYDEISIPIDLIHPSNGNNFVKLFATGFSKWLLNLMLHGKWTVEMLNSYWYRVEDNQDPPSFPNMLSLAFKFSPIEVSLNDSTGLADSNPEPKINEEEYALAILDKLESITDLDRLLHEEKKLYQKLFAESIKLLEIARYPIEKYEEWTESKRILFSN